MENKFLVLCLITTLLLSGCSDSSKKQNSKELLRIACETTYTENNSNITDIKFSSLENKLEGFSELKSADEKSVQCFESNDVSLLINKANNDSVSSITLYFDEFDKMSLDKKTKIIQKYVSISNNVISNEDVKKLINGSEIILSSNTHLIAQKIDKVLTINISFYYEKEKS